MYEVTITETGRNTLKDEARVFNEFSKRFESLSDVKEGLTTHYGQMPGMRNKLYVDIPGTDEPMGVGFTHSFWNRDISHNSGCWYQTDWVTVKKVCSEYVVL